MPQPARAVAARVLAGVLEGQSLSSALPAHLARAAENDRALVRQLCYGTLRFHPRLAALLAPLLAKPLKQRDRDVEALLLLGIYQLEESRIPAHAAVSETVAATRALQKPWARGVVNGVLRNFQRRRRDLLAGLDDAARAAYPDWLYRRLQQEWPGQAQQVLEAGNRQPPMTLRTNARRVTREAYLQQLAAAGIQASPSDLSAQGIRLAEAVDVQMLPGFGDGLVSVQDEAAQLAASLLGAQPGDRVLDACAAPGGKSCHILELQAQLAELVAMDASAERLQRVADNLGRLQLEATLLSADAAAPPPALAAASFDRILVDAPCSASGVIRRHPDIKLLRREADIAGFAEQQLAILRGVWPLLKPGGTLLYATCSVLAAENSALLQRFITATEDARALPQSVAWGQACAPGVQLLPHAEGPDGLFYGRLEKPA